MDEAYIEKSSKRDALDILEQLGGWPVILGDKWTDNNFTWCRLTEKASILGFSSSRILTEGMTFTFACNNFLQNRFIRLFFWFQD
jgi:hypothetical protein